MEGKMKNKIIQFKKIVYSKSEVYLMAVALILSMLVNLLLIIQKTK